MTAAGRRRPHKSLDLRTQSAVTGNKAYRCMTCAAILTLTPGNRVVSWIG
jgi:hypothetical protein